MRFFHFFPDTDIFLYSFLMPYRMIISDIPKIILCPSTKAQRLRNFSASFLFSVSYFVFSISVRGLVGICGAGAAQISTLHELQPHQSLLAYCSRAQTKTTFTAPKKAARSKSLSLCSSDKNRARLLIPEISAPFWS